MAYASLDVATKFALSHCADHNNLCSNCDVHTALRPSIFSQSGVLNKHIFIKRKMYDDIMKLLPFVKSRNFPIAVRSECNSSTCGKCSNFGKL